MKRLLVVIGMAALVVLLIVACNSSQNKDKEEQLSSDIVKNPNTANGITDTTQLPRFNFKEEIHDFGRVIQGEKVSYSFKFTNSGKADLIITDARGSCGCTIADYPKKPIAPGKGGSIDVTFNSEGKKGYQPKTITIIANTQPNTKVLKIKAQVEVPEGETN